MERPRIAPGDRRQIGLVNDGLTRLIGRGAGTPPPNVFTTLARNRGLFRRWLWFAGGLMPGGKLPRRDTELVILRVAHLRECEYEWNHHKHLGRRAGLSSEEIEGVREGPGATVFAPHQGLLLRATDELIGEGKLGDETWAGLGSSLDEPRLIEFCLLVGHYEMLAKTINTLGVQSDPEPTEGRLTRWLSKI